LDLLRIWTFNTTFDWRAHKLEPGNTNALPEAVSALHKMFLPHRLHSNRRDHNVTNTSIHSYTSCLDHQSPPNLLPTPLPPQEPPRPLVQPGLPCCGMACPGLKLVPYALWVDLLLSAPNALLITAGVCSQFVPPWNVGYNRVKKSYIWAATNPVPSAIAALGPPIIRASVSIAQGRYSTGICKMTKCAFLPRLS
jgi:hypothetical protein